MSTSELDLFGEPIPPVETIVFLSLGMGVESVSILVRWILEPETRPCPLEALTVIVAQVGDEYEDTRSLIETYLFPLMRPYNIRCVQVARRGPLESDGIVVLDDTRQPERCHIEGCYKLSDEMKTNGTVVQAGGVHKCAMKFKAWVIEEWFNQHIRRKHLRHAFGYNAAETNRIAKSEYHEEIRERQKKERIAFGFNVKETARIGRNSEYNTFTREAFYPLMEWGWDRDACLRYLLGVFGVVWEKSACAACPFNCLNAAALERHRRHPRQVADALVMEYTALCLNPRATIYAKKSLLDIAEKENPEALAIFRQELLPQLTWGIYRVRRLFAAGKNKKTGLLDPKKRGVVHRCTERLEEFDLHLSALAALGKYGKPEFQRTIAYVWVQKKNTAFPCREEMYTVAPATVATKARHGVPWFDARWNTSSINLFEKEDEEGDEAA